MVAFCFISQHFGGAHLVSRALGNLDADGVHEEVIFGREPAKETACFWILCILVHEMNLAG